MSKRRRKPPAEDTDKKGDPYGDGYAAHDAGKPLTKNPHKTMTWNRRRWNAGWKQAEEDTKAIM